jgi:hypothetical protein
MDIPSLVDISRPLGLKDQSVAPALDAASIADKPSTTSTLRRPIQLWRAMGLANCVLFSIVISNFPYHEPIDWAPSTVAG